VIGQAYLDSVELGVADAEVGVGDVGPAAADVERVMRFCEYLDAAAAAGGEVEVRGISGREVGVGADGASGQFDVGRDPSGMQAGVPAQNDGFEAASVD